MGFDFKKELNDDSSNIINSNMFKMHIFTITIIINCNDVYNPIAVKNAATEVYTGYGYNLIGTSIKPIRISNTEMYTLCYDSLTFQKEIDNVSSFGQLAEELFEQLKIAKNALMGYYFNRTVPLKIIIKHLGDNIDQIAINSANPLLQMLYRYEVSTLTLEDFYINRFEYENSKNYYTSVYLKNCDVKKLVIYPYPVSHEQHLHIESNTVIHDILQIKPNIPKYSRTQFICSVSHFNYPDSNFTI